MCPESIPTIPTTKILTDGLTILFQDFRGQLSWGRRYWIDCVCGIWGSVLTLAASRSPIF